MCDSIFAFGFVVLCYGSPEKLIQNIFENENPRTVKYLGCSWLSDRLKSLQNQISTFLVQVMDLNPGTFYDA